MLHFQFFKAEAESLTNTTVSKAAAKVAEAAAEVTNPANFEQAAKEAAAEVIKYYKGIKEAVKGKSYAANWREAVKAAKEAVTTAKEAEAKEAKAAKEAEAAKEIAKIKAAKEAEAAKKEAAKGLCKRAAAEVKGLNSQCRALIEAAKAGPKTEAAELLDLLGIKYTNAKAEFITIDQIEAIKPAQIISAFKAFTPFIDKDTKQALELKQTEAKGVYIAEVMQTFNTAKVFLKPYNQFKADKQQQQLQSGCYYTKVAGEALKLTNSEALTKIKAAKEQAAKEAKEREAERQQAERDREVGRKLREQQAAKEAAAEAKALNNAAEAKAAAAVK